MSESTGGRVTSRGRLVLIAGGVVAGLVLVYLVLLVLGAGSAVPRGTHVLGVDIGGLNRRPRPARCRTSSPAALRRRSR